MEYYQWNQALAGALIILLKYQWFNIILVAAFQMKYKITLIIADDHEIFRDGLALMLSKQEDISLLGQAADGMELLELAEKQQPDLVITI
jgi:hypothetical protein